MNNFNTPILFLIFNRFDTTKQVFSVIKKVRPQKLYIASDGPRNSREEENEIVDSVRKYVLYNIDWDCEVKTLFRDQNLGCGKAVSSAIDWFFENVEEGIILEDDCLPDESFFYFCEDLLNYYRDDKNIFMISGSNFFKNNEYKYSYYFSRNPYIWGWATWKRAWDNYSFEIKDFDEFKKCFLDDKILGFSKKLKSYWLQNFQKILNKTIDTWDYQWSYSVIKNNGFCIVPQKNLVSNLGFNFEGSHTQNKPHKAQVNSLESISFPLIRPVEKVINKEADDFVNKEIFLKNFTLKLFLKKIGLLEYFKNNKFIKICLKKIAK